MLTLYEHPLSSYAMKAKIALMAKGLEFHAVVPEGMMSGTTSGAFLEASPRAEIPTLIDGDISVFDSTIILEYLEDKWPNPPLLPPSPAQRARVRMIEDVMDTLYEPNNWGLGEVGWIDSSVNSLGSTAPALAGAMWRSRLISAGQPRRAIPLKQVRRLPTGWRARANVPVWRKSSSK